MERSTMCRSGREDARGGAPRVRRARPFRAAVAGVLLLTQLAGCYHYVPADASVAPAGTLVSLGITDRGRVALTEAIGPGARRIEGQLIGSTDTTVTVAVNSVQYIDLGLPMRWAGEQVVVSRDYVTEFRARRLSRTRSWIMGGLVVIAAVGASLIAIAGFGGDDVSDRPGGDPGDAR